MFIPDPGSKRFLDLGSASASNNFSILTQKIVSKLSEILSVMFIPDPDPGSGIMVFYPSRIPNPGVKKAPDHGSGSATLIMEVCFSRRCCSSTALLRSVWSAVYSVELPAVAGTLQYSYNVLLFCLFLM